MNIDQSVPIPAAETKAADKLTPAQKLKLGKAVREFESVFVGYMLKSMRNTIQKADNTTDTLGGETLESMFDVELSKTLSQNSNLGLADMLYHKMTGERIPRGGISLEGRQERETKSVFQPKKAGPDAIPGVKVSESLEERLKSYNSYIAEASEKNGVSQNLIKAVIAAESSAHSNALSSKNAKGLMQLVDSTATEVGVTNVWDPRENILGGAKYLKQLLDQFQGNEQLAVASYNAGPGSVLKHGGVPPFKETTDYVTRVMNFFELFEQEGKNDE